MPFNMDAVGACENIRREAESLAGQNYAFNLQRKTGALDFITSPENGGVDAQLLSWDGGRKIGTLLVHYDQRTKPCQININEGNSICDNGTSPIRKQFVANIDKYISTPVRRFTNAEMVVLCKGQNEHIRDRLFSDLRAAREKLSEVVLAELTGFGGVNKEWDGTTTGADSTKDIQLIDTSGDQRIPLPGNYAELILDYQNNQLIGMPALIGQGNLQMFMKLHKMSCCNSATPYGEADIDGDSRFYQDQAANAILGPNAFIMAAFGVTKFVPFNENRNIGINTPITAHTVIPDPTGYPFDWNLDFVWDECDKVWKYMYSLHYTLFNTYQADSFAGDGEDTSPDMSPDCNDELDGMTGVFNYRATAG